MPSDERDRFVEFRSQIGNTIVCPSQWKSEDEKALWTLTSADGHAAIIVWTCTVAGSGTHEEFEKTVLMNLCPNVPDVVNASTFDINGNAARRVELEPDDTNGGGAFLVYTLRSGELYHAILVKADPLAMELNRGLYEELVSSFVGIASPP